MASPENLTTCAVMVNPMPPAEACCDLSGDDDDPPAPPAGPTLSLHDLVAREQDRYIGWDSPVGDLIAEAIGELLSEIRITGARDVQTLIDRRDTLEREHFERCEREQHEREQRALARRQYLEVCCP